MSTHRYGYEAPFAASKERGPNGRLLCRMCGNEVPKRRRTWCSQQCIDEYNARTGYNIRYGVERRDHGVCARCGLDTQKLQRIAEVLWYPQTAFDLPHGPNRARRAKLLYWDAWSHAEWIEFLKRLDIDPGVHLEYWHADHIVPVAEGGGQCGLDNMRTLCVGCHKKETIEMHGRLKKKRWKERTGQEELPL